MMPYIYECFSLDQIAFLLSYYADRLPTALTASEKAMKCYWLWREEAAPGRLELLMLIYPEKRDAETAMASMMPPPPPSLTYEAIVTLKDTEEVVKEKAGLLTRLLGVRWYWWPIAAGYVLFLALYDPTRCLH